VPARRRVRAGPADRRTQDRRPPMQPLFDAEIARTFVADRHAALRRAWTRPRRGTRRFARRRPAPPSTT
jgi:hypothetical protein